MPKNLAVLDRLIQAVGSTSSLVFHTCGFVGACLMGVLQVANWDSILLVLTTIVSLEAIYLAIFIQMSVNQNTESLREVEVDVDEIQKDIDDIQEGDAIEKLRDASHHQELQRISARLQELLEDIKQMDK